MEILQNSTLFQDLNLSDCLSQCIDDYIKADPISRSVNSMSKECDVSEATLRRIFKKKLKSTPNVTTVLEILTLVSGEKSIPKLVKLFPGAVAEFLKDSLPDSNFVEIDYDSNLNDEFVNSTKYLIYKLASNSVGVSPGKIRKLFGTNGIKLLEELINHGYVIKLEERFFTSSKNFQSSQKNFVANFKAVSSFIKPNAVNSLNEFNSVRVNYSESVDRKTYKKIVQIQRNAIAKIRDLMADDSNSGEVPTFMLVAVDTLDSDSIDKFED